MRLFVAIRLSEDIRGRLAPLQRYVKTKIPETRPVAVENLHLTLKFLGETAEEKRDAVKQALTTAAVKFPPFSLRLVGMGRFPEERGARVLWVGCETDGMLKNLHREIDAALEPLGFPNENRFKEHVTLVRFTGNPRVAALDELIRMFGDERYGTMTVAGMHLFQSTLLPDGPVYRVLGEIPMGRTM